MRVLRASFAALVGAVFAMGLYLAWFFKFTGQSSPWEGASPGFVVLTGVVAAVCGLLGGLAGALLAPETPWGVCDAIAALIALGAAFAETHTPGQHHYPQALALLVAAPSAYVAGRLRKRPGSVTAR